MMAFLGPRRARRRWNCAWKYEPLVFTAAHAALTRVVLSHEAPFGILVERCLPALSSSRGQIRAQERRWPALANRLMSSPTSPAMTFAATSLIPGMPFRL